MSSPPDEPRGGLSRRQLLRTAAGAAVLAGWSALTRGFGGLFGTEAAEASAPRTRFTPLRKDGVVVIVRHSQAVSAARKVDRSAVAKMLAAGVMRLAGGKDASEAWRRFFSPGDVVGLKVNCLGAPTTHTHVEVALAVADGLRRAGLPDRNVIIFDRLTEELARAGFPVNTGSGLRCFGTDHRGYDAEPTTAGDVASCFSRIVSQDCTALVNLPLLKDHDVAGVSISLKNHFGCINNPNKLHLDGCCPAVADLNLAPMLREKQRLIVCDALEVTYDGGPTYRPATTARYGALLIGTDPVALDRVGWQVIERLRAKAGFKPLRAVGREPRYIAVAGDRGHRLGVADPSRLQEITVSVG